MNLATNPRLGDVIGYALEPRTRWARLVGIRKGPDVPLIEKFILRQYVDGDDEWPTGRYVTTWCIVPYERTSE